ncbi:MAG: aminotransferase class I/II-fold pyridoxal phosphate-dependent enzyme [Erysipelotrichaceae bacterium]|jgi:cystathionine beta-lyase|nr:aminotransferase class I/II-fold pyridoxal phosphate-dependent enzyme [Erysipelotrichaceae bacterium]
MKYDFTSIIDRHNKDSIAVDVPSQLGFGPKGETKEGFDRIPMWVADMNFATVDTIAKAIIDRAQHPCFGYFAPTPEYFEKIIAWQKKRNKVNGLEFKHIGYENGVLGGVVAALNVFCSKGDNVLLHSPTYVGFTGSLLNNGYHIVHSPLILDSEGIWRMDYEDMDKKIKENKIHAAIFCSPHNPCGRVWEKEEIKKAMEVYKKNDVFVISDEIWSDILLNGHKHTPTQSVSPDAKQRTVALYAPSKTFNLAGLIGAYHIVYNDWIRERMDKESSLSHYNSMNVFSMHALIGAYQPEGYIWVDELNQVLSDNINTACDFFEKQLSDISVVKPEGTYMLFLDCSKYCENKGDTIDALLARGIEYGVLWQDGRMFQHPCAIRLNLALPKVKVEEALKRMKEYIFKK